MKKNLAAFKKRCQNITWIMVACALLFALFGIMTSADASNSYGRYLSSYSSSFSSYSHSSSLSDYTSKSQMASLCMYIAAVCAACGDVAVLGWVGSNMLNAFGRDLEEDRAGEGSSGEKATAQEEPVTPVSAPSDDERGE